MSDPKMLSRPRRNRRTPNLRSLVQESRVTSHDLIYPIFIVDGSKEKQDITALPGQFRYSVDEVFAVCEEAQALNIPGIALFPKIEESLKNHRATEALNDKGLVPRAVREIKKRFPDLLIFTDIALDPFSSDGHDGIVENGKIINDESVDILAQMALVHAEAGADFVSPSDMMDGRVRRIREALDQDGHVETGILAYTAKYASSFYGPFRVALDSAPRAGDKKTYQMDPSNSREALRELNLDASEGADIVMVKPALAYLDIIRLFKDHSSLPIAAYNVSGEYAMVKAAAEKGWIDGDRARDEMLLAFKRSGADVIFTYFALEYARSIKN